MWFMDRRSFLQTTAAGALLSNAAPAANPKMIGIQVGAVSFVDEGVEQVLDIFQQEASINTLFIATFTYGRGIAGRQVPGSPLPDHGKQEYDNGSGPGTFQGGSYTKTHPEYYKDTVLQDFRAPDFGDFDVLEAVIPSARKRGMKTICWFEDVWAGPEKVPNVGQAQEKTFAGGNAGTLCFNNPNYRNWLLGTVEDYTRTHEIDGIMWGSERQGAFCNALGASAGGGGNVARTTCFCEHCERKARARGVDPGRARAGFQALGAFLSGARQKRPIDGFYVGVWRLMLRYPELLAWEMLWTDSLRETYAAINGKVKSIKPAVGVGWHIWHNNSFNPIYRAEQDLSEIAPYSDFLKMVMYHNCGGERMANYIRTVGNSLYGDVPQQELLDFHYRVLDYKQEHKLAELPQTGFTSNYVYEEAKRAREALNGTKTQLWPGIDIDIPTAAAHSKSTPESSHDAVLAAFKAGADGVLLSRKYSEMKMANLRGAGTATKGVA
jgi:hypothetical protein